MISESQVQSFLNQFHTKMKIFGILYRDDRGKNQKTLEELEIVPSYRKVIIENLKIEETRLAIIPTEFETEVFCWELKGTVENRKFLLYVNAKTGKVEDILVIIQTENGTLTQ